MNHHVHVRTKTYVNVGSASPTYETPHTRNHHKTDASCHVKAFDQQWAALPT